MLWACALLPHLALDAVLRSRADADQPLALATGAAPHRRIAALNTAAGAAGVCRGQPVTTALAVCQDLIVLDHDAAHSAHWRDFLAAWAYRTSSEVSTALPGALVFEVGKSLRALGPWPLLASRLREELAVLGFRHRLAVAPTPRAAWVLAGCRDGAAVFDRTALTAALAAVPVARARLPAEAAELLAHVGLRTLGQVLEIPRAALGRRFGADCLSYLERLVGAAPDVLPLYRPPDHFTTAVEFDAAVTHTQGLLFPLRRLIADLAVVLTSRDAGVQRFELRLGHDGAARTTLPVGLLAPERDAAKLFEFARLRLEQLTLPAPVLSLTLAAADLPAFVPTRRDLLDPRDAQASDWASLRERLRARLGNDAVYTLLPVADHRPERSWRRVAPNDVATTPAINASAAPRCSTNTMPRDGDALRQGTRGDDASRHAARGDDPPKPGLRSANSQFVRSNAAQSDSASTASRCPTPATARPTWLLPRPEPWRGGALRVLAGPERIESGWWDGGDVVRDYYVVETPAGQRAWAWTARDAHDPFTIHGWFA